jgi:superoxide dismutase, Fe-Mn family
MKSELLQLPIETNSLEPYLSKRNLEYHCRCHETYQRNITNLVTGTKYENSDLRKIIEHADGSVFNNAAQVWNHLFYFECLKPGINDLSRSPVNKAIKESFGSIPVFKDTFIKSGMSLFGSGWVWLVLNPKGVLEIIQESNAGNPLRRGLVPLLACDVWEHAYYLDYQNRRTDYLTAFWNVINWEKVEKRFLDANN